MKYTFSYDIDTQEFDGLYSTVFFDYEVTDEQAQRLKASFESGQYDAIDDDSDLENLYDELMEEIGRIERFEKYWSELGETVFITRVYYPEEFKKEEE